MLDQLKDQVMASAGTRPYLEALDEPAMVIDDGLVLVANEAARKLFGPAIEGRDIRFAIRHPQALEHILPGRAGDVEITGIGEIGRPWNLSVRRIDPRTLLVRLIDRSATIAAEKMRVDFVANASHELRTPLSTILGYSETLADEADLDSEHRVKFGSTIRGEAKRMLRIIEDLMSLSRIEAGRFVAPSDRVFVAEIAASAVENSCRVAGAQQCSIRLDVEQDLPAIMGDHAQLMQLLDNLLSNAIRYGCESGECAIRVSAILEDGWIRLSVTDNGPGIPREHLRRVTERFYRVDAARSRESGGTGLGLAIVKHIVERHKGTLDIASTVGEGTEVVVRLPVAS
jgi:two-component system phosphate regulon sensor histidine kinase PhoR